MSQERKDACMKIGITGLNQICMVTWNLPLAEKRWTQVLGVEPEHLMTPPWKDVPSHTNGIADDFCEPFIVYHLNNDMILEIFGPGTSPSNPWRTFLENHGEGVMNFGLYVDAPRQAAYDQLGAVCQHSDPYHLGFYPQCTYSFVDTKAELGVELNIKCKEDNEETIATITKK